MRLTTVSYSVTKALPNLRVLEIAPHMPGPYCGNLNASLVVAVIKANLLISPA